MRLLLIILTLSILLPSCDLDPNNPEDAATLVELLNGAVRLNAAMTDPTELAVDLRNSATSQNSFDVGFIVIERGNNDKAYVFLKLYFAPCFEEKQTLEQRQQAFNRIFWNFSNLSASLQVKESDVDEEKVFQLEKGGKAFGFVQYTEESVTVTLPTDEKYDNYITEGAIDPGVDFDLHTFNFQNILNEHIVKGYCHFKSVDSGDAEQEKQFDDRIFIASYSDTAPYTTGHCGNDFASAVISKDAALRAFAKVDTYKLLPYDGNPNRYSIIYKDNWKHGALHFKNGQLEKIRTVRSMRYVSGMNNSRKFDEL